MHGQKLSVAIAAVLSTLVGAILIVTTLLVTSSSSTDSAPTTTTTTVPSLSDAKRDLVQITGSFGTGTNRPWLSPVIVVGETPTIAANPSYDYSSGASSGALTIWTYSDGNWMKSLDQSVGKGGSSIRFLDLNNDGIEEILFDSFSSNSRDTYIAMRRESGWELLTFQPGKTLSDGIVTLDRNLKMIASSGICTSIPCPPPTVHSWRYDEATNAFVRS